jgi:CO dehydrogenase maturation factor
MTKAKTIVVTGKGGVGKTTFTAILTATLLPFISRSRTLVIDGDPDLNLHLLLGIPEPPLTVADVKEEPLKAGLVRQSGKTAVDYLRDRLTTTGVIGRHQLGSGILTFDFMAMGVSRENGCYCAVNNALAGVFDQIRYDYDLILIDSPAGTEHLSRQRISHCDLFCVLQTNAPAARAVAHRILETADRTDMTIGHTLLVNNLPNLANGIGNRSELHLVSIGDRQTEIDLPYNRLLANGDLPSLTRASGSGLPLASYQMADLVVDLLDLQPPEPGPQHQQVQLQLQLPQPVS